MAMGLVATTGRVNWHCLVPSLLQARADVSTFTASGGKEQLLQRAF